LDIPSVALTEHSLVSSKAHLVGLGKWDKASYYDGAIGLHQPGLSPADEPQHTRLRSIVDEAFRRRAILDMEPRILSIAVADRPKFVVWPATLWVSRNTHCAERRARILIFI
jgi:cytochrome P450